MQADSFTQIYQSYFDPVYRYALSLSGSPHIAEEITQETFFKALNGLKHFDGRQDIRAWLFTVARNCYYSHCRKAKQTVPLDETLPPAAAPQPGGVSRAAYAVLPAKAGTATTLN